MKKSKFVKVGFEFTAAPKSSLELTNPFLIYGFNFMCNSETILKKESWKNNKEEYAWIKNNFHEDDCGCEVPTPVITKKTDVEKYYLQFMEFVNKSNLTTDINEAYNGLGGCHIHLDLSYMDTDVKILFLKNIATFMSNHPWLNWALNDPNDNINANSLANSSLFKKVRDSVITIGSKLTSRKINAAQTPLDIFLMDPLGVVLLKTFAVRYNESYDTVELRIFNMPTSLEEHLFHYNIAMAIYNYCLSEALESKLIQKAVYDYHSYMFMDRRFVNLFLVETLKAIDVSMTKEQIDKMLWNIETRYKWSYTNNTIKTGDIIHKEFYLF